jgi:hypothetical protein
MCRILLLLLAVPSFVLGRQPPGAGGGTRARAEAHRPSPIVTSRQARTTGSPFRDPPPRLPGIGFVGAGYNLYYGNPQAQDQLDPGITHANIWNLTYTTDNTTPDGRWLVPDSINVPGATAACTVSGSSSAVDSAMVFTQSLQVDVSVDLAGWGAAFTASVGYKDVATHTQSSRDVYTSTKGMCVVYTASLNQFQHPALHDSFTRGVATLPTTFNASDTIWWSFLSVFGTHFYTSMDFGARWGFLSQSTSSQWADMESSGLDISAAASYAGLIKAGVSVNSSSEREMANNFSAHVSSWRQISLGNPPPSDGDNSEWIVSTLSSPNLVPLRYDLQPLSELLTSGWTNDPVLLARQNALAAALFAYCEDNLKPINASDCLVPPGPPTRKGFGALACAPTTCFTVMSEGNRNFALVFDGASTNEASRIVLNECPGCSVLYSIPQGDQVCLALAQGGDSSWGWASGTTEAGAQASALDYCNASSCLVVESGCAHDAPPNALWGAVTCPHPDGKQQQNCYFSADSTGVPNRLDAQAAELAKCGAKWGSDCTVWLDYNTCAADVVGWGQFGSFFLHFVSSGATLADATKVAMNACQAHAGVKCALGQAACTTS